MFTLIKHAIAMRKTQSVATLASVALSAAVTFTLIMAMLGVQGGLEKSSERLGADLLVIPADAAVELDSNAFLFTGAPVNMYMDAQVEQRVAAVAGVARATAQFYGQTLDQSCCSASAPARLVGYDASTDWVIAPWLDGVVDGRLGTARIVAGCDVAPDFAAGGKVLGRAVELAASLEPTGTDLDGSILMDIDEVRAFVKDTPELAELWERYGSPDTLISCVLVEAQPGMEAQVAAELSGMEGVAVIEASGAVEKLAGQMNGLFAVMAGAAVLVAAVTLFQLFARFFGLAWDRRSELALYRALGASKREVSLLIAGEAAVLVGGGVVAGLALGALASAAVPSVLAQAGSFPYLAPGIGAGLLTALGVVVAFALLGLVAIAWPLSRAGRIDPSSAMQTGDID